MNRENIALIKRAFAISARQEAEAFEALPEVEFAPSESYQNKIREILQHNVESRTYGVVKRKRLAVAMIAAAIIVSLLTACAAIKPIRNFFFEVFDEYFSFTAAPEENYNEYKIENYYTLKYIPNGFNLLFESKQTSKQMICYNENNNQLTFYKTLCLNGGIEIDCKNAEISTFVVNGLEVKSFTKNGQRSLYWEDGTYFFTLTFPQSLPDEEVEKIIAGITAEG